MSACVATRVLQVNNTERIMQFYLAVGNIGSLIKYIQPQYYLGMVVKYCGYKTTSAIKLVIGGMTWCMTACVYVV